MVRRVGQLQIDQVSVGLVWLLTLAALLLHSRCDLSHTLAWLSGFSTMSSSAEAKWEDAGKITLDPSEL